MEHFVEHMRCSFLTVVLMHNVVWNYFLEKIASLTSVYFFSGIGKIVPSCSCRLKRSILVTQLGLIRKLVCILNR